MSLLERVLTKLFKFEDLSPLQDRSYLLRWTIARVGGRAIYLHKILASDWSREPHDHPKRFWSIGLKGEYIEETYVIDKRFDGDNTLYKDEEALFSAPWFRTFGTERIHRLRSTGEPCWTLVAVGKATKDWGFYEQDGTYVPYIEYMKRIYGDEWGE